MRIAAVIALVALAGCAPVNPPAPSSSYTLDDVQADATAWAQRSRGRVWTHVAPTGSMLPLLDDRSVALYEAYEGQPVYPGDAVYFLRDGPGSIPVLHTVTAVNNDSIRTSGVNARGDGWHAKSLIRYRLAGVLYSTR